ncbi:hypothetical protein [Actinokineospora sp. UTMC 2448]|uniref:hypothetical protein n=1 Tax=Actinokineospora sp. UTMC 2448 TaxID=2268449 RepID=UPI00216437D6|nr:hypothetical protein [Actinokineospora sp. UTMC 2448]UVS77534.1 hypothetical protein Actkin_01247 [Actinokineospora sp. UTMC 2448]
MTGKVRNSTSVGGNASGIFTQAGGNVRIFFGSPWLPYAVVIAVIALGAALVLALVGDEPAAPAGQSQPPPVPATAAPTTTAAAVEPTTTAADPRPTTETTAAGPATGFRRVYSQVWAVQQVNVDVIPPSPGSGSAVFTLDYLQGIGGAPTHADLYAGSNMYQRQRTLAEWRGAGVPDGEECQDAIRRFGTARLSLAEGGVYCAESPRGRIVVLSDVEFHERDAFALLTVWARD